MAECLLVGIGGGNAGSDDVTATAAQILAPYTAITRDSDGEPKAGTIPSKSAATYDTSASDRTINAGQYLAGNQLIRGVSMANIAAGNIKKGVNVKVGDSANSGRLANITGTYTTVSSGQAPVTAAALRRGYSGFANGGGEVKGTMPEKGGATYYATTEEQTIAAGQYLTGAQKIGRLSQTNLSSGNIRKGVSIYINNGQSNIFSATGSCLEFKLVNYGNAISSSTRRNFTSKDNGVMSLFYIEFGTNHIPANFMPVLISGTSTEGNGVEFWQDPWNCGYTGPSIGRVAFPMTSVIFAKGHILIPVPYGSQPWGFRIAGYLD